VASNERKRALLYMTIAVLLWSVGGLLIKLSSWDALALNGGRNAVSAIVLWVYLKRPLFTWSRLQVGGAIIFAIMNTAYVLATQLTTAANAVFLHYTAPIWVLFFSAWLLKEKPKKIDWATLAAIIVGIVLMFAGQLSGDGLWGNFFGLLSGFLLSIVIIILRKQKDGSPMETILLGMIIMAVVGAFFIPSQPINTTELSIVLVLGVAQFGIPFILYTIAIKTLTAVEAVLIQALEPALNPLWVAMAVGEVPPITAVFGSIIILVSVIIHGIVGSQKRMNNEQVIINDGS